MNAIKLTEGQKEFIHNNRLEMSMIDMSKSMKINVLHVRRYMKQEGILLDMYQIQHVKKLKRDNKQENIIPYDPNTDSEVFVLSKSQQKFIIDNRFTMSSRALAGALNIKQYHVLKFMKAKDLMLTDAEIERVKAITRGKRIRRDDHVPMVRCMKPLPSNWTSKPWEMGLNLVTMSRD